MMLYVRQWLDSAGFPQQANTLHIDNMQALDIAQDEDSSKRTKHIDVKHKKIQELCDNKQIRPQRRRVYWDGNKARRGRECYIEPGDAEGEQFPALFPVEPEGSSDNHGDSRSLVTAGGVRSTCTCTTLSLMSPAGPLSRAVIVL